jgi:phenylacetate-coenzyme A ligase PaaK-like adenylate-forming protein
MKIVGRLLKKTTEIGFKRNLKENLSFDNQKESLSILLDKAKKTNFGKSHEFQNILTSFHYIEAFQNKVPIVDYEEFYETWLHRSIDGAKDNTWPGQIKYFALSSGTTGSPSKRIPVTDNMIRSFQRTSMKQITTLHHLNLPPVFFQKSVLAVGGSTKLEKIDNRIEGDLSGILKKHTAWIASPFTKPGNDVAEIKDWNQKLNKMVEQAPKWDIGVIAGVPSWCILLMEKIIEKYNLESIHDIWPNFQVYVHGGVFMQPYLKRFDKLLAKKVHLLDTYLASEGYFAYQKNPERKGMQLLLNSGIFYEFIPFNNNYFENNSNLKNRYNALTLQDVEEGVDYALVISTNAGLWRYIIGDLIQFTDVEKREIKITGRIKQYLSLMGEHLSLDNITEGLELTSCSLGIDVQEFGIVIDEENERHIWYVGTENEIDINLFIKELDGNLCTLNDDYKSVRKYNLKMPIIQRVPTFVFYQFMESLGKLGSQNKFPRVMNKHQASEWKRFLSDREI